MKKDISANQYIKNKNEILEEYFWIKQSRKKIILDYEFCEQKNISRPTFYRWLKELGGYESFIEKYREKMLNNEIFPPEEYQTDFFYHILMSSLRLNIDELSKSEKLILKSWILILFFAISAGVYGYINFGYTITLYILYMACFFAFIFIGGYSIFQEKWLVLLLIGQLLIAAILTLLIF